MAKYVLAIDQGTTSSRALLVDRSLRVKAQAGFSWWLGALPVPNWFVFSQPLGFIIYFSCALAETNRAPFDLPEAETELVAGFHSEYSSMKFAMFFMAEYAHMVVLAGIATCLFLGGWHGPILPGPVWFLLKVFALVFFFIWERGTFPRLRYDQVMRLGWKFLMPAALANLLVTGFYYTFTA